jgi:hypothetical protein
MFSIQRMFLSGKARESRERVLLTTGLVDAGMRSPPEGGRRLATPHLAAIRYQALRESTFRQE